MTKTYTVYWNDNSYKKIGKKKQLLIHLLQLHWQWRLLQKAATIKKKKQSCTMLYLDQDKTNNDL